ncbi:hypothetical protein OC835_004533 [Tilletia horrida]|nr:hypothetical protein OC835_004533 [Tilletia horrida]
MPQRNLNVPVIYAVVGAYRLIHDETLWKPMWADMHKAARQAGIVATIWAVITWPIQRLWVFYFMKGSAKVTGFNTLYHRFVSDVSEAESHVGGLRLPLPSLTTFAAFMFVLSQCSSIMEFWLRRKLRAARSRAYDATVRSRNKAPEFWGGYVEEWEEPPTEKAIRQSKKEALYVKLASPVARFVILKFALLPLDFVPFLSLIVGSYLRSLSMVRQLHQPMFAAKKMTPFQIELWITERQHAYRSYGFVCALLESLPIAGLFFSISNRVGAAMYAFDLEKRQALFRSGEMKKLGRGETYSVTDWRKPSGLREDEKVFANQLFDGAQMPGAQLGGAGTFPPANSSAAADGSVRSRARTAGERMFGEEST